MTPEQILEKHGRVVSGPAIQAMKEYASQQASEYIKYLLENNNLSQDEEESIRLDFTYYHEPSFDKVTQELYNQFIEQQQNK